MTDETPVDWMAYRKCGVCKVVCGRPCRAQSAVVVEGRPNRTVIELPRPHTLRKLRTGYSRREG